jgi:hypothetical protein
VQDPVVHCLSVRSRNGSYLIFCALTMNTSCCDICPTVCAYHLVFKALVDMVRASYHCKIFRRLVSNS